MPKQNLSFKNVGKQILSINNLIESYFNKLRQFILDLKKFKFNRNNSVFLAFVAVVFFCHLFVQ